jgi:short-subunit dehydrogenase
MRNLKERYGSTAIVAGASEGIGAAFSSALASEGLNLVLIARRMEPLLKLAGDLESRYKITVKCISCDLSDNDATMQIDRALDGLEINILIYNAALSSIGPFTGNSEDYLTRAPQVNMITPLKMVHHFGSKMVGKGRGAVVLMSSMAGLQGSGYLSVYAATKAFNRILAESLWYEWGKMGVDVLGCIAGATATPGYINTLPEKNGFFAPAVLEPAQVAEECLDRLGKQPSFITGRANRIASFFMQKVLQRKKAITIMGDTTRRMYRL